MDVLSETTEKINVTSQAHLEKNKLLHKIFVVVLIVLAITGLILIVVGFSTSRSSSSSSTSALQSNPLSITLNNPNEEKTQDIFPASTNPNEDLDILKAKYRGRGGSRKGESVSVVFLLGILVMLIFWGLVTLFKLCFNPCRTKTINTKITEIVNESNEKRKCNG